MATSFNLFTVPAPDEQVGKVVLYLHGDLADTSVSRPYWPFLTFVAQQTSFAVVAPDYAAVPFLAQVAVFADLKQLYRQLAAQVGPHNVLLMGYGTGAGLALALAQHVRDEADPLPARLVLLAPRLDFYMPVLASSSTPEAGYLVDDNGKLRLSSSTSSAGPVAAGILVNPLQESLSGLPATSLFTISCAWPQAEASAFAQRLRDQAIAVRQFTGNLPSPSWLQLDAPEADTIRREIVQELRQGTQYFSSDMNERSLM